MKTRQSKRLHNQNVGTTKPVHLHNNEETTMSKYLYYAGYVILAALTLFSAGCFASDGEYLDRRWTGSASTVLFRIISENSFMRQEIYSRNSL